MLNYSKSKSKLQSQKIISLLLTALLALGSVGCSNDGEVLATFNGGEIKRKELRDFVNAMQPHKKDGEFAVREQDNALRMLSLVKIANQAAEKDGYTKSFDIEKINPLFDEEIQITAFLQEIAKDFAKPEYKMLQIQHLFLKIPQAVPGKKPEDLRVEEANELLNKLNSNGMSDVDIENLIAEKTEHDHYKPLGGHQEPICSSCSRSFNQEIIQPLLQAENGKFVLVKNVARGHWIVRKLSEDKVDQEDLSEYYESFFRKTARVINRYIANIKDENRKKSLSGRYPLTEKQIESRANQTTEFIVNSETRKMIPEFIEKLKKEKNLVYGQIRDPSKITPETVLYTINGKQVTYADLTKLLPGDDLDSRTRLQGMNILIMTEVFKDHAKWETVKNSDSFKAIKDLRKMQTIAFTYMQDSVENVEVTDKQIRELYDMRKSTQFKGKKLKDVKEMIRNQILSNARNTAAKSRQEALIKEYNLQVKRELLKAGKI